MRGLRPFITMLPAICALAVANAQINADDASPTEEFQSVTYSVAGLPVWLTPYGGEAEFNPQLVIFMIQSQIAPTSWAEVRGAVEVQEATHSLVIRQTPENHRQIADLLRRWNTPEMEGVPILVDGTETVGPTTVKCPNAFVLWERLGTPVFTLGRMRYSHWLPDGSIWFTEDPLSPYVGPPGEAWRYAEFALPVFHRAQADLLRGRGITRGFDCEFAPSALAGSVFDPRSATKRTSLKLFEGTVETKSFAY